MLKLYLNIIEIVSVDGILTLSNYNYQLTILQTKTIQNIISNVRHNENHCLSYVFSEYNLKFGQHIHSNHISMVKLYIFSFSIFQLLMR